MVNNGALRRASRSAKGKAQHSTTEELPGPRLKMKSTTGPGKSEKGRRSTRGPQQKLNLATLPHVKDPPQLLREDGAADSCRAATKHAIPKAPQQLKSKDTDPILQKLDSAKVIIDTYHIRSTSRIGVDVQHETVIDTNGDVSAAKKDRDSKRQINDSTRNEFSKIHTALVQPESRFRRLTLSLPRNPEPRGKLSAGKKYTHHLKTEVDWNEDLRPTDDEKSTKASSDGEANFGSTRDSESMGDEERSSLKRKASNAQINSEKRRKPAKGEANIRRESNQRAELPLTSLITDPAKTLQTKPIDFMIKAKSMPGEQSQEVDTRNELEVASSVPKAHNICQDGSAGHQHEIIEITSSPVVSETSSSDYGIDVLRGETYRVVGRSIDGRGKTVAQKLVDALHGVQLHSQLQPAVETTLHCAHKRAGRSSRMSIRDESQSQDLKVIQQTQTSLDMRQQGHGLPGTLQMAHATTVPLDMANPCNTGGLQIDTKPQGSLIGGDLAHIKVGSDGFSDRHATPNCLQAQREQVSLKSVDLTEEPRPGATQLPGDVPEHDTDSSSQNSPEVGREGFTAAISRGRDRGTRHTPESEKPLLSLQTPIQSRVSIFGGLKTGPRSSIVDSNGSPRRMLQANLTAHKSQSPLKDVHLLTDIEMPDSSSSNYNEDSNASSLDSSDDELTWSKYQRDMFMEYGFQTASMKKSRTQLPPPKENSSTGGNSEVPGQNGKQSSADPISTSFIPPSGDSMIPERDAHGVSQNRAAEVKPGPNQISTEKPQAHDAQHVVMPLSTEYSGPLRMAPEAHQLSQSNDSNPQDWISALQSAQKSAHDLLLETNQASQIECEGASYQLTAEQETIRQVLQIYRQGCNCILDDLFHAQQVRVGLYQQQMKAVKEQHRQICQELVEGLQDLDHRVQGG
ncbi:hypothetical protein N7520_008178 [Penicillium odoratum]|uniref:uncharacterized protein n=1 Tax=Penicillium odoratum TaxID=1167516 RepID=UPI002547ED75|nr:uncharacterized protein N7520_008178 [Penicillium odoratum]KAJ5761022.1 hypothetical protein N7520_008178 [Penicillium odoratum]